MNAFFPIISLLFGVGLLMMGRGLMGTLLPRSSRKDPPRSDDKTPFSESLFSTATVANLDPGKSL